MDYLTFLKKCITPHHTVRHVESILKENGYIKYEQNSKLKEGKYYYLHNTLIVAFNLESKNVKGCRIVGTHSDSPVLKLKTNPFSKHEDLNIVHLKPYGGGLWHTWFDRNLGIAGYNSKEGLITIENPLVYIPSLAIHSAKDIYGNGFVYDKEQQLRGILSDDISTLVTNNAHDLSLFDLTGPILSNDLVYSPRQDNLSSTFCAVDSFVKSKSVDYINILVIYDYEEVGSEHCCGAESSTLQEILGHLIMSLDLNSLDFKENSVIISADAAHASHFNYLSRFDTNHQIELGGGVVIKHSSRYATDVFSTEFIEKITKKNGIKTQHFELKNDVSSGGTIGPMVSTKTGISTVDIGVPLLGMHSIREVTSMKDINELIKLFNSFYAE